MNSSVPVRIMVADDHPIVREGLAALIARQPDLKVVAEADNGEEAVALFVSHRPDLILMDLRMPCLDGVSATRRIREIDADAKIIMLTTYDGDEDIYRALSAGARSFLLKDGPREQLIDTIRAVAGGQVSVPVHIADKLARRMQRRALTTRELEVLQWMARGKSNQEIGNGLFIAEGTVKAHVNSILSKLGVSDRTQAVTKAIREGLASL